MMTFCRLILPVDGSAASDRGVAFAVQLAKSEGAAVHVCSAAEEALGSDAAAERHITAAVDALHRAGVSADGTLLRGIPVAEVDHFVRARHGDGIVLGTNGRGGIERMFIGSVTTALLRVADVPVVTVHGDDALHTGPTLVAIDASTASVAALECAIDRSRVTGAALHLLHVFEERRVDRLSVSMGLRPHSAQERALTDAETALAAAADRVRAVGLRFTTELERGDPAESILTTADRCGAGTIAIGTHGRGALERFMIGSVSDRVVRNARVPVFVVHRRTAKIAEPRKFARDRIWGDTGPVEAAIGWQAKI